MRNWVLRDRERRGMGPDAARAGKTAARTTPTTPSEDPDERIRQLEARVAELEAKERKLATEGDILRKVIPEMYLPKPCQRLLQNQRGAVLDRAIRRNTEAVICRLRFRITLPH